jgi:hypothetical protein
MSVPSATVIRILVTYCTIISPGALAIRSPIACRPFIPILVASPGGMRLERIQAEQNGTRGNEL